MLRWRPLHITIILLGVIPGASWAAEPSLCPSQTLPPLAQSPNPPPSSKTPKEPKPADGGKIDVNADYIGGTVAGELTLKGHASVRQGDRQIHGDEIRYSTKDNTVKTDSSLEYEDPLVKLTGNGGNYSPTLGADFRGATFELQQRPARGTADAMKLTPQGVLDLKGVRFTTCPKAEESWEIKAKSVTLDTGARVGEARAATVEFEGVPILYLPWLSFPLSSERKSGFLYPTIGNNSRSGASISVPYYWNIAPNADLTFEPIEYSRRNVDLGGEARYMNSFDKGSITWNFLPYDSVFDAGRSRIKITNAMELPENFRFSVDAENVSDTHYFEDFAQGPEGTSTAFLQQQAKVTYRDEHWKIDGELQHYRTTDYTLDETDRPYARVPRLGVNGDFGWGSAEQVRYGFESEIVNFHRSISPLELDTDSISPTYNQIVAVCQRVPNPCVNGWRFDVMPQVSLDFSDPGYFIRPGVAWRATQYELDNTQPGQPTSPSRTVPIASFDTGLMFERDAGSHDQRRVTLEPRLLYLYVPYRNQNDLPIFDTGLPDLDPVELFRNNRYVGADRVGDANQVSLGVTSRLLDAKDGRQFLTATIGQIYYIDNPRVLLPEQYVDGVLTRIETPRTNHRSDFVAQVAVTAFDNWSGDIGVQWNSQTSQTERGEANVQYKTGGQSVVNVGYRYQRDVLSQAEISGSWPVSDAWNVFVRGIYSLQDHKSLERFAGFEYRACCWRVRLGGRSFVSNRTGASDTGVYLQLELTGLASVGSESDSFLTTAIRGYEPADNPIRQQQPPPGPR
ncbi:MAG TPA: LPS assembly protein LptD [Steroidobacteraceae bacterium]